MSNREIKFRARDLVLDKYVDWKSLLEGDNFRSVLFDKNFTIEQYTGLKDKNGKEIWESDVLQISDSSFKYLVIYKRSSFVLEHLDIDLKGDAWGNLDRITDSDMQDFKLEVIGNIHENPELLKG